MSEEKKEVQPVTLEEVLANSNAVLEAVKELTKTIGELVEWNKKWQKAGRFQ